ncbi:MAG: PrsW family intramembrane metalloprotease [Labilithrix sp.]|nr:PrsW family intramembrane metalloprotease [Labilithrix sp.]MCW5813923.1 PrsW family intramembrane metalloprotease [Labilithrix sp.]
MKRVLVALLCFLVLGLLGCETPGGQREPLATPFAGTKDVELTYEVVGAPIPAQGFGKDLRALVLARLGAAQIGADVDEDEAEGRPPRLHIVVDESLAPRVDELTTWTGTLLVLERDPTVVLAAPATSANLTRGGADGEVWYEGRRGDVLRAIETWTIDRDHKIVAEPIPSPSDGLAVLRWRTRVVRAAPRGELGDGAIVGWGGAPNIRVRAESGSPSAAVIDGVKDDPAGVVLARGRISLGAPAFANDALHVDFGEGAGAYARARRERILLATPRLPPLRRVDAVGLPPNRTLTIACLVVPILLSLGWLFFIRRFDRAHPEPMWLIGATFLLGAVSTVPAAFVEELLASSSHWLDPNLVTYGGQMFAFPLSFAVFTVVVGLTEEGAKRAASELAVRRAEFDEPVDGIVYGIVASLGFAAAENIRYFAIGRLNAPLVIARCFMSVPAHMFFGALWGYALGHTLVDPKTRRWAWIALAAACHGLFDALLSTDGAGILAVVLNLLLASAFVALVRRSLRHGPITDEMRAAAIAPEDRALFRVGRPLLFWASAVLLHALAFGIFVLGAYYQLSRHRPSMLFVVGSTVLLAPLILAALGVATALPLDVVVDSYGITFAGAARPWRKIRAYKRVRDHIEVDCEGGPLLLGPAPKATLEEIGAALKAHLGASGGQDRVNTLQSRK